MHRLVITAAGRLVENVWHKPDSQEGYYEAVDVSVSAEQYLFEEVVLSEGATLRSIFTLVLSNPLLLAVLARHRAREICEEGLADEAPQSAGIPAECIEHVAVYRTLERHSGTKRLQGWRASFHGVGAVLQEDELEQGTVVRQAGQRPLYSFSFTSPQVLRDLPLKLDTSLPLCEGDFSVPEFWTKTEHLSCEEFTLGDILDAIFWELTFYGVGEEREQEAQSQIAEASGCSAG